MAIAPISSSDSVIFLRIEVGQRYSRNQAAVAGGLNFSIAIRVTGGQFPLEVMTLICWPMLAGLRNLAANNFMAITIMAARLPPQNLDWAKPINA